MKVFLCVDSKNGMMFNNRRQSRDSKVIEKVLSIVGNDALHISEYSRALFPEGKVVFDIPNIKGFVFIENPSHFKKENVNELYIFNWNRHYPADIRFDEKLDDFKLVDQEKFVGSSHDEIELKHYVRK